MIQRNTTRTIYSTTEATQKTNTPADTALAFPLTTLLKFYVGYKKPFASRYFHFSVLNTNACTLTVKYWDGTQFSAVEDLIDQTLGFTQNGFVSWSNPGGWVKKAQTPITDVELYWIEITVSANLSATTELQAVLNLFTDDALLRTHYPHLVADTRWLPSGRTNFLEQHIAAKDLIMTRLKQGGIIDDESQVIDVNEVSIAAVHALAYTILWPICLERGEDDPIVKAAKGAYDKMVGELSLVKFDFDFDNSGAVEANEEDAGNRYRARGSGP